MNIVIYGAGAIGSFFGGLLSKNNNVVLIGRKKHVNAINKYDLKIEGKTKLNIKISAMGDIKKLSFTPDLVILTTKAYDAEKAINEIKKHIDEKTFVLSIQNGLNNLDIIKKNIDNTRIMAGITTHGCLFLKPGSIKHTGFGKTIIGKLEKNNSKVDEIAKIFNKSEIQTEISDNIARDIWIKGIVNSSINPVTAFFECKNGYLLKNPILENMIEKICIESTKVVNALGMNLKNEDMLQTTKNVINDTSENYSSMLQSIKQGKISEIDSINGEIVKKGKKKRLETGLNELLVYLVKSKSS